MNKKKLSPDELAKKAITSKPLSVNDEPTVVGSLENLKDVDKEGEREEVLKEALKNTEINTLGVD